MSNQHNINNLPATIREDGIVDVVRNSHNITTVEAEYDRAMLAEAEYERAHPLEAAIRHLEHAWKYNRFSSSGCDYGWNLKEAQKNPLWEQIKAAVEPKGLPVTWGAWKVVEANHIWKWRHQMVQQRRCHPKVFQSTAWWPQYQEMVKQDHPVLRGEWKG